jgi:hypothetical protein
VLGDLQPLPATIDKRSGAWNRGRQQKGGVIAGHVVSRVVEDLLQGRLKFIVISLHARVFNFLQKVLEQRCGTSAPRHAGVSRCDPRPLT